MIWKTMNKDLATAKHLLQGYLDDAVDGEVGVQEITIVPEGSVQIARSDWVIELAEIFERQYGDEQGETVTNRVLTNLLLQGDTIH